MLRLATPCTVLSLVLSVAACGEDPNPSNPTGGGPAAAGSGGSGTGGGSGAGGSATAGSGGSPTAGAGGSGGRGGAPGSSGGSGGAPRPPDAGRDAPRTPDSRTDGGAAGPDGAGGGTGRFSFFVTSLAAMRKLSGSQDGFGGDLRYGEATGLAGADKICTEVAELSMPGSGAKGWRAFLSTVAGGANGGPVHARDRIGQGPWYDRLGRMVAANLTDLIQTRPRGADPAIINDLPNESGIPNHLDGAPGCTGNRCPDNHDVLTGTNEMGRLRQANPASTCNDWTNKERNGRPWCGHSWPRQVSGVNWMSALAEGGCAPGVNLREMGGPNAPTVGSGGGYGAIYCFALTP
jgi:hypothetical protein